MKPVIIIAIAVVLLIPLPIFAETFTVKTNKSTYLEGDVILISGTTNPATSNVISMVVVNHKGDIVTIGQFPTNPSNLKDFSYSIDAKGPLWLEGEHTIKLRLAGKNIEIQFDYVKKDIIENKISTKSEQIVCPQGLEPVNGECPDKPVVEVTSEPKLGIASFVDKSKDPQSYIDRYNSEPSYKKWFDENYPQYKTIHEAVGLELTEKIPDWVKNIFLWYGQDQVSEDELLNAIKYLINEGILLVD